LPVPIHKAVWQARCGGVKRNKYFIKFSFYGTQMSTERVNYKNKPAYAVDRNSRLLP